MWIQSIPVRFVLQEYESSSRVNTGGQNLIALDAISDKFNVGVLARRDRISAFCSLILEYSQSELREQTVKIQEFKILFTLLIQF